MAARARPHPDRRGPHGRAAGSMAPCSASLPFSP